MQQLHSALLRLMQSERPAERPEMPDTRSISIQFNRDVSVIPRCLTRYRNNFIVAVRDNSVLQWCDNFSVNQRRKVRS